MPRKVEIGDVIEIGTPIGLAYAQFIHVDPRFGELIRTLPGTYPARPANLSELVAGPDRFVVLYPLSAAVRQKAVTLVGQARVPDHALAFPIMLIGGLTLRDGTRSSWALYDGKREQLLSELRPEHRGLPIVKTLMHPGLVNAIVNDWHPDDELDGVGLQKLVGPDVALP